MTRHALYVNPVDAPPAPPREETGDAVALKRNDEQIESAKMLPATADQTVLETDSTGAVEATGHLSAQSYAADEIAAQLIANGYRPVPINRGEKGPKIARWQERTFRPDNFLPSSNIGILTGHGVVLLDIDVTDKEKADTIVNAFIDRFEDRGEILIRTGLAPKVGIPIRAPSGMKKKAVKMDGGHQIEVLATGQQFVAYGRHPTGCMYEWDGSRSLVDHCAEDLPELTEGEISEFLSWVIDAYGNRKTPPDATERSQSPEVTVRHGTMDRIIIDLLRSRRNTLRAGSYINWRNIAFGTLSKYRGTEFEAEAYEEFVVFSTRWENGMTRREDIDKLWRSEREDGGKRIGPGTAIKILRSLPSKFLEETGHCIGSAPTLAPPTDIGAQFTGLANRLYQQLTVASDRQASNIQIAGVLATLSAVIGPCAVIQNGVKGKCCTNLYLLSLAKTGAGKETIRTLVSSSLHAAGRGSEVLGGSPSDVSFQSALARLGGRSTLLLDEAGIIAKANKTSANSHQRLLIALLMKAYGCGLTRLESRQYADRKKNIDAVERPRPTVMMTSTVQDFADGASQEDSASGFFNRFLAFVDAEHVPFKPRRVRPNNQAVVDFPDDISKALSRLDGVYIGPELAMRLPEIAVILTGDALRQLDDFKFDEVERHLEVGGTRAETWSRAVENAQRVAGLLAVSDALTDDVSDLSNVVCGAKHVDLALQIVRRGLAQLESIAHMAGQQATRLDLLKNKVLQTIKRNDGRASRTQINRTALRGVRADERQEILDTMVGDGEIRLEDQPHDGKSGPKPDVFLLPNRAHTDSEVAPSG